MILVAFRIINHKLSDTTRAQPTLIVPTYNVPVRNIRVRANSAYKNAL